LPSPSQCPPGLSISFSPLRIKSPLCRPPELPSILFLRASFRHSDAIPPVYYVKVLFCSELDMREARSTIRGAGFWTLPARIYFVSLLESSLPRSLAIFFIVLPVVLRGQETRAESGFARVFAYLSYLKDPLLTDLLSRVPVLSQTRAFQLRDSPLSHYS